MIASFAFGQTKIKSDSILVSRVDLIKQIELNDKRKAQWDYCVEAITKADSVVVASRRYIASLDTVIALKDETIALLSLAKDVAINTTKLQTAQLKAERKKGNRKAIGWGVGGSVGGFGLGALFVLLKN
jgi:hypothetical protein